MSITVGIDKHQLEPDGSGFYLLATLRQHTAKGIHIMKQRVTIKTLEAIADRLNVQTGSPAKAWDKNEDGQHKAQIGNFYISQAYGGYSLHRMVTDGGGVSDVFSCGHIPARQLADRMYAYMKALSDVAHGDVEAKR